MSRILHAIKAFAFWGIIFLLILVFGIQIGIKDIISIAAPLTLYLPVFCLYCLVSVIAYPLLAILTNIKTGLTFIDTVAIALPSYLCIPYKGFDVRGLFKLKNSGMDRRGIAYDIGVHIIRFIETVLWWALAVMAVISIINSDNAIIMQALMKKTTPQKLILLGIVLGTYLLLLFISWIIQKTVFKRWKQESTREVSHPGTMAQQYFNRHPEKIPAGCKACGGPYPECRASCNLFDE